MRSLTHQWVYTSESLSKENKDILWINFGLSTFFQDLDILCINCLSVRAAAVSFLKRFLGLGLNFHLAPCPRASQTQLQFALLLSDFKWRSPVAQRRLWSQIWFVRFGSFQAWTSLPRKCKAGRKVVQVQSSFTPGRKFTAINKLYIFHFIHPFSGPPPPAPSEAFIQQRDVISLYVLDLPLSIISLKHLIWLLLMWSDSCSNLSPSWMTELIPREGSLFPTFVSA